MPLTPRFDRPCYDPFERKVQAALRKCKLPGVATNNVVIPQITMRNLPNEQDVLVLTNGLVYTLDAKNLHRGFYSADACDGPWKYSANGQDKPEDCTFMTHPFLVALKKQKAVLEYVNARLPNRNIDVVSVIVVPKEADVSGLKWQADGAMSLGARLLLAPLPRLCAILEGDVKKYGRDKPKVAEMVGAFGIDLVDRPSGPACELSDKVEVKEYLRTLVRPLLRQEYRGVYKWSEKNKEPARIEILPWDQPAVPDPSKADDPNAPREDDTDALIRGFRNNLMVLKKIKHDAIPTLLDDFDTPMYLAVVSEFFSGRTLHDVLAARKLTWDQARAVFRPVVDLLRKAHDKGVVHRYLDPTCILVPETGDELTPVKVQGFFGAVVGGTSTIGAGRVPPPDQRPPYIAPERYKPELKGHPMQDAYLVAQCLCAALTGSPLTVPAPPAVPADVPDLLRQLLREDPDARRSAWTALPARLERA